LAGAEDSRALRVSSLVQSDASVPEEAWNPWYLRLGPSALLSTTSFLVGRVASRPFDHWSLAAVLAAVVLARLWYFADQLSKLRTQRDDSELGKTILLGVLEAKGGAEIHRRRRAESRRTLLHRRASARARVMTSKGALHSSDRGLDALELANRRAVREQ
jgi:hypothetical protein